MVERGELPVLPKGVTREARVIWLFLAYLDQPATSDAIMALAGDRNRLREVGNYQDSVLRQAGGLKTTEGLRRLMMAAPALEVLVSLANHLPSEVMPEEALPSAECMNLALQAYHRWVHQQARRR